MRNQNSITGLRCDFSRVTDNLWLCRYNFLSIFHLFCVFLTSFNQIMQFCQKVKSYWQLSIEFISNLSCVLLCFHTIIANSFCNSKLLIDILCINIDTESNKFQFGKLFEIYRMVALLSGWIHKEVQFFSLRWAKPTKLRTYTKIIISPFIWIYIIMCTCKRRGEEFKSLQETTFRIGLFCMKLNSNHAQNTLSR